jgi:PilZ domain
LDSQAVSVLSMCSRSALLPSDQMDRSPFKPPVTAGGRFPNRRSLPRYTIVALVEVVEPVSQARADGWTSTISDTGCHVRAANLLPLGEIVQLKIEREGQRFQTWARVASAVPDEGMGLAFFDTDPEQRKTLKRWMDEFENSQNSKPS